MRASGPEGLEGPSPEAGQLAAALAGKYMTFRLAREHYAAPILKVRELVGLLEITRVPGSLSFMRGVVNLRGKVIPVVDLRAKLGMSAEGESPRPVIIVVQVDAAGAPLTMGVLVDEVLEVRSIAARDIEPPPPSSARAAESDYLLGVGKAERAVVFLLDLDRILSSAEVTRLASTDLRPPSGNS
ncbi:MAG: chemotaxis protein CheW [Myxococcales bacterium]